ncbi:MAG: DUF2474 domain-containing protein [Methylobacteriaceae bacterium]|nr:DUF2474 domain-containing protein [Rhodoblastus sp.]MCC0006497.1 DUF2474 domain-containing protein [Methylobacteriaceae bacterium]
MLNDGRQTKLAPLSRRLLWFVLLYAGGVLVVGGIAYALRFVTR